MLIEAASPIVLSAEPSKRAKPSGGGTDKDREGRCFDGLEEVKALLLAVSGGPDSMALLLMATRWVRSLGAKSRGHAGPALHVATVDHGLRSEGRAEADMVAATATRLGVSHATLTWTGPKPSSRVQEKARAARYALLAAHARAVGADHILTGHHADDQAETVLFRLGRGSGLSGLAGMRRKTALAPGLWLTRPLLDLFKADLVAVCRAEGVAFAEDPTNRDPLFARARLRAQAPALTGLGLDTPGLVRLARRLARADAALERETDRAEAMLRPERGAGWCQVDLTGVRAVALEIAIRLMRRAISQTETRRPIRLDRLEDLTEALWSALETGVAYRATLAGTLVTLESGGRLTVCPEPSRRRGGTLSRRSESVALP